MARLQRAAKHYRYAPSQRMFHIVDVGHNPTPPWPTVCHKRVAIRRGAFQLRVPPDAICRVCTVRLAESKNYPRKIGGTLGVRKPPIREARAVPLDPGLALASPRPDT